MIRMKTIYAFSALTSVASLAGAYHWMSCPGSVRAAQATIADAASLRSVTQQYLRVDLRELTLTGEAVDHGPAKPREAAAARMQIGSCSVTAPNGMLSRSRRSS